MRLFLVLAMSASLLFGCGDEGASGGSGGTAGEGGAGGEGGIASEPLVLTITIEPEHIAALNIRRHGGVPDQRPIVGSARAGIPGRIRRGECIAALEAGIDVKRMNFSIRGRYGQRVASVPVGEQTPIDFNSTGW